MKFEIKRGYDTTNRIKMHVRLSVRMCNLGRSSNHVKLLLAQEGDIMKRQEPIINNLRFLVIVMLSFYSKELSQITLSYMDSLN
jgi:hypothetical protein